MICSKDWSGVGSGVWYGMVQDDLMETLWDILSVLGMQELGDEIIKGMSCSFLT